MSGNGWKAIMDVREWSGSPSGCSGVVGSPFRMSGSGWETLLDNRRPSRMSGSGRESLSDFPECSEGPTGCP